MGVTIAQLETTYAELLERAEAVQAGVTDVPGNVLLGVQGNNVWMLFTGVLVFFMHCGFTMLEAGSVRVRNSLNIMFKNVGTVSLGALSYFFLGHGLAYGVDSDGDESYKFIGSGNFLNKDLSNDGKAFMFFQLMFAATAATIVSGAVAGRVSLPAYFLVAIYLSGFAYPVVSHWVWATGGWISAFTAQEETFLGSPGEPACGMLDFAGSAVVHMTGGVAAFWGALILGPRMGRFAEDGTPVDIPPHSYALTTLGTFILWFGWYGFNCGSTLAFDGTIAGKVASTTTLAPSAAALTGMAYMRIVEKKWALGTSLNCVLAGLVSITAPCPVVQEYQAVLIGMIGAIVYIASAKAMLKMGVDDPVNAIAVHGACGAWGAFSVGVFATPETVFSAYSERVCDFSPPQTSVQLVGILAIFGWVTATMVPIFLVLKYTGLLRVSEDVEEAGLDMSEHGSATYEGFDNVAAEPYKK